jgi:hypothetical protein
LANGVTPSHKILSNGYVDVKEAQKLEKFYVTQYRNNGWKLLNGNKTGGIGWIKLPN